MGELGCGGRFAPDVDDGERSIRTGVVFERLRGARESGCAQRTILGVLDSCCGCSRAW